MQQCPLESLLRPCASQLDGSEPLVLAAATRFTAVALVAAAALEQLATPPVPTYGEPLGIEVDIDSLDVVIVLTLGLSYSADLQKSIRPTRLAVRGASRTSRSPVHSTCVRTIRPTERDVRAAGNGSVALTDRVLGDECAGVYRPSAASPFRLLDFGSHPRDLVGRSLVPPLRPVIPRCRGTRRRTRDRRRPRHDLPVGATLHSVTHRRPQTVPPQRR